MKEVKNLSFLPKMKQLRTCPNVLDEDKVHGFLINQIPNKNKSSFNGEKDDLLPGLQSPNYCIRNIW